MFDFVSTLNNTEKTTILIGVFLISWWSPILFKRKRSQRHNLENFVKTNSNSISDIELDLTIKSNKYRSGKKSDIEQFLLKISKFAKNNHMKVVYPGSVKFQDEIALVNMILVGKFGILNICCYGYTGFISISNEEFEQDINGSKKKLDSPILNTNIQVEIIKKALNSSYSNCEIYKASVFTNPTTKITSNEEFNYYNIDDFLSILSENPLYSKDNSINVEELTNYLLQLIKNK